MLKILDLFSGIGGFSLGLHRAGMTTVAFCECEPYPQAVLKKNFPGVPIYDDVRTLTKNRLRTDGIDWVDLVCGGFPCQPFSAAGKQQGTDDHRHLWPEMLRIVQEFEPAWVIGENVAGFIPMALDDVCIDLENAGYEVQPLVVPACAVDAPHRRDRVWIIAHRNGDKHEGGAYAVGGASAEKLLSFAARELRDGGRATRDGWPESANSGEDVSDATGYSPGYGQHDDVQEIGNRTQGGKSGGAIRPFKLWPAEPNVGRVAYGVPARVDRLRGLGNAVVPQIPEIIGRAILAAIGAT